VSTGKSLDRNSGHGWGAGSCNDLPFYQMTDKRQSATDPDNISAFIFDGNDDVDAGVPISHEP
jgi:hypothetical protein